MSDSTAVTVITPSAPVEVNLDQWPEDKYNRLIPVQTIRMPSDFFVPVVQVVVADPVGSDGKSPDTYSSRDVPPGHRAPTKRLLDKFASAAGVTFSNTHRFDDGTDPDVMGVRTTASMLTPTGQRISREGSQLINIRTWFGSQTTDAERSKFRKQFYANVESRAMNRAIRGLLSMRQSYSERELTKPFAVVSYAPNMNHPAVQQAFLQAMVPALDATFGPDRSTAHQLAPGQPAVVAVAGEADEAPSPAQLEARAASVPDWARPATADAEAQAEPEAAATSLVDRLRAREGKGGMAGAATEPQRRALRAIFGELDWERETIPVLVAAFGDGAASSLTANQAAAILAEAEAGGDGFRSEWIRSAAA